MADPCGNTKTTAGRFGVAVSRHGAPRYRRALCGVGLGLCLSCGGAPATEPESPETEQPAITEAEPVVLPPPEEPEPVAAEPAAPAEAQESAVPPEPRDVRYRVTPQGLVIEAEGVRFEPKATPVRVGGGWGVKVEVKATSATATRSLLSPQRGPLAFAGTVKRGSDQPFGDEREGDGEVIVGPGKEQTLTRTWPDQGQKPLTKGQELTLEVGLWGVGESAEARRPLNKFFVLRMVAGTKTPQPVIQPPEVD